MTDASGHLQDAVDKLEQQANLPQLNIAECATISLAISLKRIADAIDGSAAGLCVTETRLGGRPAPHG